MPTADAEDDEDDEGRKPEEAHAPDGGDEGQGRFPRDVSCRSPCPLSASRTLRTASPASPHRVTRIPRQSTSGHAPGTRRPSPTLRPFRRGFLRASDAPLPSAAEP